MSHREIKWLRSLKAVLLGAALVIFTCFCFKGPLFFGRTSEISEGQLETAPKEGVTRKLCAGNRYIIALERVARWQHILILVLSGAVAVTSGGSLMGDHKRGAKDVHEV